MGALLGVAAGDRFLIAGLPGESDRGVVIGVDSVTNTCQLNCTLYHAEDLSRSTEAHTSLATIGMADFATAMASGLLIAESTIERAEREGD